MATPHFVNRENMIADSEYIQWLSDVKKRFRQSQGRALVKVNAEMLDFYWSIGRDLVMLKAEARWGDGVVKHTDNDGCGDQNDRQGAGQPGQGLPGTGSLAPGLLIGLALGFDFLFIDVSHNASTYFGKMPR